MAGVVGGLVDVWWARPAHPVGWRWIGPVVVGLGLGLMQWAVARFRRHRTAVMPWKPTRIIVEDGPFRLSRNPIYLGFAITLVGVGLWMDALAIVLAAVPALGITDRMIVRREEAYLTAKFGTEYTAYTRRVRRWL